MLSRKDNPYYNCLFFSLNALSRSVSRMAEEEFSQTGMAPSYAFLLMAINDKPGIVAGNLAEMLMLAPSTVTRLVEKMEYKGYLERVPEGKFTRIFPTRKALTLNIQIKQAWKNLISRYSRILGDKRSQHLTVELYQAIKLIETG